LMSMLPSSFYENGGAVADTAIFQSHTLQACIISRPSLQSCAESAGAD
jgi:hypothetical protein